MPKTSITLCALIFFCFHVKAQSYSVSGHLADSTGVAVPYASLALADKVDTNSLQFTVASESGYYTLKNVEPNDYYIVVACVGYEVKYVPISVTKNKANFDIEMISAAISMKEVMVQARKIPILMNGDTVVYNSSSFKTQSNATVEDLMKKLPGLQVGKDGTLTAEGEKVTKVLINGKEFFGGNVEAATKNLDADLVDKIEVIDKKTDEDEFTDVDSKETEKVINLVLKEKHSNGYFGKIRGGYGTSEVYDVHGNINFFRDAAQLSLIGGLNNISKRLYGWRDMQTLNSFSINPMNNWNSYTSRGSGVSSNTGIGANLHFEPLEKVKVDLSYIVTDIVTVDTSLYNSEVYLPTNTLFSESQGFSLIQDQNHKVSSKIEFEPDTLNRIVARFQYETLANDRNSTNLTFNYRDSSQNVLNSGVSEVNSGKQNSKLASKIHWTRKAKKNSKNYFLGSVYYGNSFVNQGEGNYFNTVSNALLKFPQNEAPLIRTDLATDEQTFATTSAFHLEISKKFSIQPGVNWMGSTYSHDFQWKPNNAPLLESNSPSGNVRSDNLEYFMHFIFKIDSFTTLRVVPEVNQMIEKRSFSTDTLQEFSFNKYYFIPFVFVQSSKPHNYNLYAHLRANVERPQTAQLLPVVNTTDPYNTIVGNIQLKNFIRYSGYMNYRKLFGLGKFISLNSWNTHTLDPVVSKLSVDEFNYSTREILNYKNATQTSQTLSVQWPFKPLKASISGELGYEWSQSFQIQNDVDLEQINASTSVGTELQWNEFDKWSMSLGADMAWNRGSIGGQSNNKFTNQSYYAELVLNPIKRLEWSAELDMEVYGANAAAGAQSIPILTSQLSYSMDSSDRWSIGLKAFDILDQNQNLWRYWTANRFIQSQNLAVRRYVMFTVRYKIKKPISKKNKQSSISKE